MLPAVAGEVDVAQPRACEAEDVVDYSKCFAGEVPACYACRDEGLRYAADMLTTSYRLSDSGEKNYSHSDSTHLIATGRIAAVEGLPADLLTHGVEALVDFEVEHAFLHPTPEPPSAIRIAMDTDMFAWGDSGISRLALRHSVLPYLFYHRNQVGTMVRELERQTERAVDWQSVYWPPHAYSSHAYGGDVSPKDSVLATSLPRLRAIEAWLESALPDWMDAHVSPDGTVFRQPPQVDDIFSTRVGFRVPRSGGFYDRDGALNPGDRLLVAFRKEDFDGQFYRVELDPQWKIFWGAEMEAVAAALRKLRACVAKRTGEPRLLSEGDGREALALAAAACRETLEAQSRLRRGAR